jgi:hypothetical protein
MPINAVLPVDASGNKTKVKLQYLSLNDLGEIVGGSALVKYVSAVDNSDLPDTGTAQERRVKQETEMSLTPTLAKFINPPSLVYVTAATVGAKQVGKWVSERSQSQLTGVPATPDTKQMIEGVFLKLVEILQANGDLPS